MCLFTTTVNNYLTGVVANGNGRPVGALVEIYK